MIRGLEAVGCEAHYIHSSPYFNYLFFFCTLYLEISLPGSGTDRGLAFFWGGRDGKGGD